MTEVAFVSHPRQNLFFAELVAALRDELEQVGVATSLHTGRFPAPERDRVYALVPPHEYHALTDGALDVPPDALARTIFVCAEQPETDFFGANVRLAPLAGAVFDINPRAVREFAHRGIAATHLQLGYTARWDRLPDPEDRDIDVAFLGCHSPRRGRVLGALAESLWQHRVHLGVSDNSRPNWSPSASFLAGEDKFGLLARAKVMLNVHQGEEPYFEWLRAVQAVMTGCVIVSEHSADLAPLRAGEHLAVGRPETLDLLVRWLLEDEPARRKLQHAAYEFLRDSVPLRAAAERLADTAATLAEGTPVPRDDSRHFRSSSQPLSRESSIFEEPPPVAVTKSPDASVIRRALKELKLDMVDVRRAIERAGDDPEAARPPLVVERESAAWAGARPRVSVLVTVYDYAGHVGAALRSLAASTYRSWEAIVVDDASGDDSLAVASEWISEQERRPALVVHHNYNRGLPSARNTALAFARGEFCFILDADNELFPHCLERLVEGLDRDPGAVFAYGALERFHGGSTVGIGNRLPWEPARLRTANFVDAMALIRTDYLREVGGYSTDRRLHGWEDYDLWCATAERGQRGAYVPEILARYRSVMHSMVSTTNLSTTDAYSVLIERYPRLMVGVEPPL